jgi:hypothetical protein
MDPRFIDGLDYEDSRFDVPNSLLKQDSMANMREWESQCRFDASHDGIFLANDAQQQQINEYGLMRGTSSNTIGNMAHPLFGGQIPPSGEKR